MSTDERAEARAHERAEARAGMKMFGAVLPRLPGLAIRLGVTYLRFKKQVQKGEKLYRKELEAHGIDHEIAAKLASVYSENGRFIRTMISANLPGFSENDISSPSSS